MTPMRKSRAAASAPSISGCGARSLPIASTTTLPVSCWAVLIRRVFPAGGAPRDCPGARPAPSHFPLDLQHLAAFVESALRAHAVRQARLLTVGARDGLRRAQGIVGAALARARFRVAAFRIRHDE